jgi:hypothetical protein
MKTKHSKFIEDLLESGEITINPELNKYENVILFPEKLKKAKAHIAKVGMPKEYYEQMEKRNEEKKQ